jgi:hypothetical protein
MHGPRVARVTTWLARTYIYTLRNILYILLLLHTTVYNLFTSEGARAGPMCYNNILYAPISWPDVPVYVIETTQGEKF